jgi:inward rectifier potassium channel
MAMLKRVNPFSRTNEDTGFSSTISSYGGRFINKNGTFNLKMEGGAFLKRHSLFQTMLSLPSWVFICILVMGFMIINLVYTSIYLLIGVDQLQGIAATTAWGIFKEVYFFSTETFTTVGYGRVNPVGDGANFLASIEAMSGFLSFAVATGLIYGRFARPKAHIAFSEHAVIAPFKEGTALMFRLAPFKNRHNLTDVTVRANIAMLTHEGEEPTYKYYELKLERQKIDSLVLNWTIVHPIDEDSPLLGLTAEDMLLADLEMYVLIKGFDEVYSSIVQKRVSYTYSEIRFNHKFEPMYREGDEGTVMELDKLSSSKEIVKA